MLDWQPVGGARRVGRPVARWEDSIVNFVRSHKGDWRKLAQDRDAWSNLEESFVEQNEFA